MTRSDELELEINQLRNVRADAWLKLQAYETDIKKLERELYDVNAEHLPIKKWLLINGFWIHTVQHEYGDIMYDAYIGFPDDVQNKYDSITSEYTDGLITPSDFIEAYLEVRDQLNFYKNLNFPELPEELL